MVYQVERIEMDPQQAAIVRGQVPPEGIAGFLGGAFGEVMGTLGGQGLAPCGPPFARYTQVADGFTIEAGFPVEGEVRPVGRVELTTLPGGDVLLILHRGSYGEVARAYDAATTWMAENDWVAAGEPWEAYLDGPEVPQPRTIVHVPCRPA